MRVNYGCPGGAMVVGDIDRGGPLWKVFYLRGNSFIMVQIEVAVAHY